MILLSDFPLLRFRNVLHPEIELKTITLEILGNRFYVLQFLFTFCIKRVISCWTSSIML